MKKFYEKIVGLLIFTCIFILSTVGKTYGEDGFLLYPEIEKHIKSLQRKPWIYTTIIGRTSKKKYPIYLITIDDGKENKDKLRVMITARIHGSEPAGMKAVLQFVKELKSMPEEKLRKYLEGISLYIIPVLNPEGSDYAVEHYQNTGGFWDKTGRKNGNLTDVNRDFLKLQSKEAKAAVKLFNKISPHVVLDLHEYSSMPLLVSGIGWWRAKYFDFMIGAGRNPDIYPPLSYYARGMAEKHIFPYMRSLGFRGEYYATAVGNFSSFSKRGANGADYFNIRGALTFLIETAGYDQGLSTYEKRTSIHHEILIFLLDKMKEDRKNIITLYKRAEKFTTNKKYITLSIKQKPSFIMLDGQKVERIEPFAEITINSKRYVSNPEIVFKKDCPPTSKKIKLPPYYFLITQDLSLIELLLTHKIDIYSIKDKRKLYKYGFVIPTHQKNSILIAYLLDNRIYPKNKYAPKNRCIVLFGKNEIPPHYLVKIKSLNQARYIVRQVKLLLPNK